MDTVGNLQGAQSLLARMTGKLARSFFTYDFGRRKDSSGISVVLDQPEIWEVLFKLRPQLGPGLIAFSGTRNQGFELVVTQGIDQFDALRKARTEATERGLDTEQIIERLRRYHKLCDISVYSAETDTIIFLVRRPPEDAADLEWFVRDLKDLCPDLGPLTETSVADWRETLATERQVFIWWD